MNIPERIIALREKMKAANVDIYIIPTADFHQSEYVGEHFKAREFITGFSGSDGTAVITQTDARLWTDGRYFIQAADELRGSGVKLMKMGEPDYPTLVEYLEAMTAPGRTIGFDGRTVSVDEGNTYLEIAKAKGADILFDIDFIDEIWADRPELSKEPAFALDIQYTGETTASKLERIREVMARKGANYHAVATIDDICWILNIRGNDIEFFPLVLSYAIISMDKMDLYIDESKLSDGIKLQFEKDGIELHPYNDIYEDIKRIPEASNILIDPDRFNYDLYNDIPASVKKIEEMNPAVLMKASKNEVELENIRKAEIKDSIAHIKLMKWLKENFGKIYMDELGVSAKLDELRAEQGNFIRPSFEPISAYGEHCAIVHYTSTPETNVELKAGNFLLLDTGAGFYEGSTDITRTFALGEVPKELKEHFTLVAISNLTLADAKFLEGCIGANLDILARKALWDRGLNYNHGTGHGVGYLLNIHEAPVGFRYAIRKGENTPIMEGLLITDEPGIYIEGSHGIRLENELLARKGEKNEYGQFMYFETLTLIPFDLDAIDVEMMHDEEKRLLNEYHAKVYETMAPYLDSDEQEWLKKYTRAI